MYDKMPFGLMSIGETFQRAMYITFVGEREKFVVIYLDEITVFSDSYENHLKHLEQNFLKCRKFGLSLNPRKSHFSMQEGKLLGHIVLADGIKIDLEHVKAIMKITIPGIKNKFSPLLGNSIFSYGLFLTLQRLSSK